jgi:hypothetical protein
MGLPDKTKEKMAIEKDKIAKSMKRLKVLNSKNAVEKFGKEGVQKLIKKEKDNIERSKKVLESFSSNKTKEGLKKENLEKTFNKAKEGLKKENLEKTFNKAKEGLNRISINEDFKKVSKKKIYEWLLKWDDFYPIVQNKFRHVIDYLINNTTTAGYIWSIYVAIVLHFISTNF